MGIQIVNYEVAKGQDWDLQLTFEDANGDPIDITGRTIYFTVKKKKYIDDTDDDNAALQKNITSHTDPTNGITEISLTDVETEALKGEYCYDIKYKKTNGDIFYAMKGNFSIVKNSSRRTS